MIFRFEIADAIRREILAPFSYYPLTYQPSEKDRRQLQAIRRRFEASKYSDTPMSKEEFWIALARVYKTSKAKTSYLQNIHRPASRFANTMYHFC